jgi:plasmid stabilization system protein ParE
MKLKVVLTPFAKLDLKIATDYYKEISKVLAKRFLNQVKAGKNFISKNPLAVDVVYSDIRMHLLKKFPYHLHYYIDETKNQIVILAIEFAKKENLDVAHRK